MRTKILLLTISLFTIIGNASAQYCTSNKRYTDVQFFDSSQISIGANIQYGIAQDFQGNPDTLRLDLYYPNLTIDTSSKRPFILLFHGGGFSSGDKQSGDIRDLCIHLAMRGFVCASANYRIGYNFTEYGQYKARYRAIQDGHAALRFIVNSANTVRIDTNWLFVGGQSAGSLLALGMVYADQFELDSVSLLYNATSTSAELGNLLTSSNNLTNKYTIKGIFNNWGGVAKNEIDVDEMLPTIAFHGEQDPTVLIDLDTSFAYYSLRGSRSLHTELTGKNICSELTVDKTGGHGIYRNASSKFRAQRASCFFKRVFCKTCASFYTTDSVASNCSASPNLNVNNFDSKIKVFPNPFDKSFRIIGVEGHLDLTICNSVGQIVYKKEAVDGEVELDLNPGIYFLQAIHLESNTSYSTKLIKN